VIDETIKKILYSFEEIDFKQRNSNYYLKKVSSKFLPKGGYALDFGCGDGEYKNIIEGYGLKYCGLEIHSNKNYSDIDSNNVIYYDGVNFPFKEYSFDLIFANQVFEHLHNPSYTLSQLYKILKSGGHLVGSTSQIEPYHGSILNYTLPGLYLLLKSSGFNVIQMSPGVDGLSLIFRRIFNYLFGRRFKLFEHIIFKNKESPINHLLTYYGKFKRLSPERIAYLKFILSGYIVFWARKP
jgi:SAM-dependent methyltransferase